MDLDPQELETLMRNPNLRSRRSERPGHVTVERDGLVQFESTAGIRIHGGISRTAMTTQKSFRVYFREAQRGINAPGRSIGFERPRRHRVIILHGDERTQTGTGSWHYVNPLAYDIARKLGVPTPEYAPAMLSINGGPPQPYVVTEYLDSDFYKSRFGHSNFLALDTKDRDPPINEQNPVTELRRRYGEPQQWTVERIGSVVDLDNLSNWFLTALVCGTRDMFQGKMMRDLTRDDAKWFWIAWDYDMSFGQPGPYAIPQPDPVWEDDQFDLHFGAASRIDERIVLLRRLFRDPQFRQRFADLFVKARTELVTPDFIAGRLAVYEALAANAGITDRGYQQRIRDFLAHRSDAVRRQLIEHLRVDIPN
jgi:hypothetical protein